VMNITTRTTIVYVNVRQDTSLALLMAVMELGSARGTELLITVSF